MFDRHFEATGISGGGGTMTEKKLEILASFPVVDEKKILRRIVIAQEIRSYYPGKDLHFKNFYLDEVGGPKIQKTNDPDTFKLLDGTLLKRKWVNYF
jgi:hypothetical protein